MTKKMSLTHKAFLTLALPMAMALTACGGSDSSPLLPALGANGIMSQCPPGTYNFGAYGTNCVSTNMTFENACAYHGGQLGTADNTTVCKTTSQIAMPTPAAGAGIPLLNSVNDPRSFMSQSVMAGDKILFEGSAKYDHCDLGNWFPDGNASNLLRASDGVEIISLTPGVTQRIARSGTLRIGFAITDSSANCWSLSVSRFQITRCMDRNNQVHECQ